MSMLAEPKRKQKWSLNPRGKEWSEDTNKFGQKLLEKMGWSKGKGLGANENGMTEHVKVSFKNDSKGMGYKESDDQWTEHESNFSALLKSLSGKEHAIDEIKLNSLEEKSEKSRARVHYRKFTRGKDLSRYSEKDLANIFGKKSLKELKKVKQDSQSQEVKEEPINRESSDDTKKSTFLLNRGSMADYFKKKLPNFGNSNGYVVGNNGVLKKADDSESDSGERPSFGFGFNSDNHIENKVQNVSLENIPEENYQTNNKSTFVSYLYKNNQDEIPAKIKKEKKKRILDEVNDVEETPTKKKKINIDEPREDTPIKKKKVKSKKTLNNNSEGLTNPAFNPLFSPVKVEKHVLDPIEESSNETLNDTVGEVAESFEVSVQINSENTPVKNYKMECVEEKAKKRKKNNKDQVLPMDTCIENEDHLNKIETLSDNSETKKKKKKRNKDALDISEYSEVTGISELDIEKNSIDTSSKKPKKSKKTEVYSIEDQASDCTEVNSRKKKKSKNSQPENGFENPFFNMSSENAEADLPQIENPYEHKIKDKSKKKKSKKDKENMECGLENPTFNNQDNSFTADVVNEDFEVKRKDKSKKKQKQKEVENQGLDNPALNLNDSIEDGCDLMLNIVSTPVLPSEKKLTAEDSFKIQKLNGVRRHKSVRFSDVTRERIIPSNEEIEHSSFEESQDVIEVTGKLNDSDQFSALDKFVPKKKSKKLKQGLDNTAFDQQANHIEENINSMANTIDKFQAEIENDINEAKLKSVEMEDIMVGEIGNPEGPNEQLSDGTIKLKFAQAKFGKSAKYIDGLIGPKKSYKHLIKGDIVVGFKEANLHEIEGYAVRH